MFYVLLVIGWDGGHDFGVVGALRLTNKNNADIEKDYRKESFVDELFAFYYKVY